MPVSEFDPPERFVAGTVGPPGQRTFFLQARAAGRLSTVSVEKLHVSVLADRIEELLDTVEGEQGPAAEGAETDTDPLDTPIEEEFRVTTVSLAWDEDRSAVVIECHDRDPDEDDDEEPAEPGLPAEVQSLRVVLSAGTARAFAARCQALVAAGRPSCPFCGGPIDPEGHICPRANGYRR